MKSFIPYLFESSQGNSQIIIRSHWTLKSNHNHSQLLWIQHHVHHYHEPHTHFIQPSRLEQAK